MSVHRNKKTKKWEVWISYKDFTGKYKNKHLTGFTRKKDAEIAAALWKEKNQNDNSDTIRFDILYDKYLAYKKTVNKASSIVSTGNKVTKHILPYFSKRKVQDITVHDIRDWQNEMRSKTKNNHSKYSIEYLQGLHTILSSILDHGQKYHNITKNVAKLAGNFVDNSSMIKEMDFFTYDEWKKFEDAFVYDDFEYKCFFQFLYWTGCRRGEAQALTWNDFNADLTYVTIKKTLSNKVTGMGYQITAPKTKSSNRKISIPDTLKKALESKLNHDMNIDGFSRSCFVFGVSTPLSDETIRRKKNEYCKLANVKQIRVHDFRHSHASFLFSHNIDVAVISKRLGHSNVGITMSTYIHMLPDKEDIALKILNEYK